MPTTKYLWDDETDSVVMEKDGSGATQAVYTTEAAPFGPLVSMRRNNKTYNYVFDGLGSTAALADENGQITDTYRYDAWGNVRAHTGTTVNPYGFLGEQGYQYNESTGDYYVRERPYEPKNARWKSKDPLGFIDGLNPYLYAGNGPATLSDPSGTTVHVFMWEGTLGVGIAGTGVAGINSAMKNFFKPIVDSFNAPEWGSDRAAVLHYYAQKKFNPAGFLLDVAAVQRIARKMDSDCCYPRIVFVGYSWGGNTLAKVLKKLSENRNPKTRVLVDSVFTVDPVFGRWWVSTPWSEDASKFDNFCEWENHYQTVDTSSLKLVARPAAIKGDTIRGASNINQNGLFAGRRSAAVAHVLLPQRAAVRRAFRHMLSQYFRVAGIRRTKCCGRASVDCAVPTCLQGDEPKPRSMR